MSFSLLKSPCHPCDRITLDGGGGTIAAVISIARRLKFGAALWHFSDMAFLFGDVRSKGAGSDRHVVKPTRLIRKRSCRVTACPLILP